ncbi:MAG: hypothetical protein U0165_04740 [Polyangiaceae bacterium]
MKRVGVELGHAAWRVRSVAACGLIVLGGLVGAGCGGEHVDAPKSEFDKINLNKLAGSYELEEGETKQVLVLDNSGRFKIESKSPKKECTTTGFGNLVSGNGGYLEVRLETDTCRVLVVSRVYRIEGGTSSTPKLIEDAGTAGGPETTQEFKRVGPVPK